MDVRRQKQTKETVWKTLINTSSLFLGINYSSSLISRTFSTWGCRPRPPATFPAISAPYSFPFFTVFQFVIWHACWNHTCEPRQSQSSNPTCFFPFTLMNEHTHAGAHANTLSEQKMRIFEGSKIVKTIIKTFHGKIWLCVFQVSELGIAVRQTHS